MILQHLSLLLFLGVACCLAQHNVEALGELKKAHVDVRSKLSKQWASDPPDLQQLLCAKAEHAGHVVKNSRVEASPTIRLSRSGIDKLKSASVPVYTACQVYVSETWKFIFVRNPKSSSTAIIAAIKNQLCNRSCSDEQFRQVRVMQQLTAKWDSYFVFTVVRNPWLRGLSAYGMFTKSFLRRRPRDPHASPWEKCGLPFEKFAEDAYNMRTICTKEDCCAHIPSRGFLPGLVDSHIADQAHCIFLPNGDPLVDYIGTAEDLDAAWADIVAAINDRTGTSFEALPVKNPNGRGPAEDGGVQNTCSSDKVLSVITQESAYSLARHYALDVIALGYATVE